MRRILVDNARRKKRELHGGNLKRLDIAKLDVALDTCDETILLVDEALEKLAGEVSQNLLQITQEALANVAKHARATRVLLTLRNMDESIYLQIIDNGRGFDLDQQPDLLGHGLSNMEQRARQIGGEFDIVTSPGEGTAITIRL